MPSDPQTRLTDQVEKLTSVLDSLTLLTLSQTEKDTLRNQAGSIRDRLQTIQEELLCIGLLGGTGVGKSCLLNCLAGGQVASTSHRRPHTDQVLISIHRDMPLPELLSSSGVPFVQHRHDLDTARHLLLCDLPDFDSLVGEHRQMVLHFLEHLDILVWIASPEKYADKSLSDFLRQAPKAGSNFYFLLNKADQLVSDGSADGLRELQTVTSRYLESLRKALADRGEGHIQAESRTYLVSCLEPEAAWNQLSIFREHLLTRLSLKQISRIKAANLAEEVRALIRPFERELAETRRISSHLQETISSLQHEEQEWRESLEQPIAGLVEEEIRPRLLNHPANLRLLIGPGRWIARAAMEWRKLGKKEESAGGLRIPEELSGLVQDRLEQLAHRISAKLLRENIPQTVRQRVEREIQDQAEASEIVEEWRWFILAAMDEYDPPNRLFFLLRQSTVYAVLLGLLLLALGGRGPWTAVLTNPQPEAAADLLFSLLQTTFSQTGLAALLSLLLLELLAGMRFFKTFKKLVGGRSSRHAEAIGDQLLSGWEKQQRRLIESIASVGQDLDAHIQALRPLAEESSRRQ